MSQPDIAPDDGVRDRQQQIASDLRALILSGDLRPGDRLPSTDVLVRRYGVTNQTVQRALGILKAEQFVEGQKGRGVFVTGHQPVVVKASHYPAPTEPGAAYGWLSAHAIRGWTPTIELLAVGEVPAPVQVAAVYGIEAGSPVVQRHQLLLLDGEPAELVWHFYRADVARGTRLAENRKIKGGTPAALAELGLPLRDAVDRLSSRLATVEELVALKLPEDMPITRTFRVVFTDGERPVEVSVLVKASHLFEQQYWLPGPPSVE